MLFHHSEGRVPMWAAETAAAGIVIDFPPRRPANTAGVAKPPETLRPLPQGDLRARKGFGVSLPSGMLAKLNQTHLGISLLWATSPWVVTAGVAAATLGAAMVYPLLGVIAYPVAVCLIAREQRGLELMTHDASHRAWSRQHPRLNDALASLMVAIPVMQDLGSYWRFHREHHRDYGSAQDPCKRRCEAITASLSEGHRIKAVRRYMRDWFQETAGKPSVIARMLLWHLIVVVMPLGLVFGFAQALALWLAFWAVPMLFVLPCLRMVAELEEHLYREGGTEADTTATNLGLFHRFIHPYDDGFHWIHHCFPGIPVWKHKQLHRHLLADSPEYRASPARDKVLGPCRPLGSYFKTF